MTKPIAWKMAGVVFAFFAATAIAAQAQTFSDSVNFDGSDGAVPVFPGLVQGIDGNLYGTTLGGGEFSSGTVFKMTPSGGLTTPYSFCTQANCTDGGLPQAGLILGIDGNFYGSTTEGGSSGYGTIYRITPQGILATLHSFVLTDGASPFDPPFQASDGNFYGTTTSGGQLGAGTIFKMSPQGELTTLYEFQGTGLPWGTLTQATDGALYGTVQIGGGTCGAIYRITISGTFRIFHAFDCTDGGSPSGGLIQADNGKLYGTTYIGGANNSCYNGCGTIYSITLSGTLSTIYNFDSTHGEYPLSGLIQGSDNNLYGTTYEGGTGGGWGTVFRFSSSGVLTTLHSFTLQDGAEPYGALVQATGGTFYGTTPYGGTESDGTAFSLSTGLGPFVALVHDPAKVGQMFGILGQNLRGTTKVSVNGTAAAFTVKSNTLIIATVPPGATTGYVTVVTPSGTLTSNVSFHVIR